MASSNRSQRRSARKSNRVARQFWRCASANARERVPQIVDAKPFKPCRLGDGSPRPLEIDAGLPSPISGTFEMRERREDGERRRAQIDQLLAGLAVGQEYDSALEVDELPAGMQNFARILLPRPMSPRPRSRQLTKAA